MRIEAIRIKNYKCFRDTGLIPLSPHFTVFVGQNNAGKTALLEALWPTGTLDKPHLEGATTDHAFPRLPNPKCEIELSISVSGDELKWRLISAGTPIEFEIKASSLASLQADVATALTKRLKFDLLYESRQNFQFWHLQNNPFQEHIQGESISGRVCLEPSIDKQNVAIETFGSTSSEGLDEFIVPHFLQSVYMFRAARNIPEISPISHTPELNSDASNLASVLLQIGTNPYAKNRFVDAIRSIFPSVFDVTSHPIEGNTARIMVTNRASGPHLRPGILVPLGDSGSGIAQVSAILYVALTSHLSKVIIIDEPNSFLHPGAAKKLLQTLKRLGHQYVVTTHSPDVIRAADPDVLHLVRSNGMESSLESLDRSNIESLRRILSEIGVRLSDVFGADKILWVEGTTEERCFPRLLAHIGAALDPGIVVIAMVNTGDLESTRARASLAWELYERLSTGKGLVPPALAFSFDQEGRNKTEMQDMKRRSKGLVHFLPRRSYENYLLDPSAISAVLGVVLKEEHTNVTPDIVASWLGERGNEPRYSARASYGSPDWVTSVNAPLLLRDLFSALSKSRLEYRKTTHSVELTEWLLTHQPERLEEVVRYVQDLIGHSVQDEAVTEKL